MYIVQCIDYIGYSTRTLCAVCEECSVFAIHYKCIVEELMIDGDKKVVSKQTFASFPKVNSLQSWEYYAKIASILSLEMNYSIVINKCF